MAIVRGDRGVLKAGHQIAALVGPWSASIQPNGETVDVTIEATVRQRHPVYSRWRPVDLILTVYNREWIWTDVDLGEGETVTVHAGPPRIR